MPKPPTFTDREMLSKISDYFVSNGEMPTIAEVKRWGCGDTRAQNLLRQVKGLPQPQPQPRPQPQPQPVGRIKYDDLFDPILEVDLSKLPKWLALRLIKAMGK